MTDLVNLSLDQVHALALRALTVNGMGQDHARAIADTITQGQRDECHSHGFYRVLVCMHSQRCFAARQRSRQAGVWVSRPLLDDIQRLIDQPHSLT